MYLVIAQLVEDISIRNSVAGGLEFSLMRTFKESVDTIETVGALGALARVMVEITTVSVLGSP